MTKQCKGITLVALVITIIILLILAGISIATLTGSGLFEKARLAEQKSKEKQEEEEGILKDYENKINEYISSSRTEFSSGYSATKLWEVDETATDVNNGIQLGTITLSDSIQNYDEVVVTGQIYKSDTIYSQATNVRILKANYYLASTDGWTHLINLTLTSETRRIAFTFKSDTELEIKDRTNSRLVNVYGIKY